MAFLPAVAVALAFVQGFSSDVPAKYRSPKPDSGAVVAKVNGVEIKGSDVESFLWEWRGAEAVQYLINYQLVKGEAEKLRITVPEKEVEDALAKGIKDFEANLPPGQTLDAALQAQGYSKSRLYIHYRTEALLNAIALRHYDPKALVKVSTIVFRPDSEMATSMSAAINKAQAAYDRLKKGETWEAVFRASTNNPDLIKTNGLLGWREITAFPPAVQTEIKQLKAGDVTKPAQTENGFQIFRIDVVGKDAKPAEEQEMRAAFVNGTKRSILDNLRKEAKIERLPQ